VAPPGAGAGGAIDANEGAAAADPPSEGTGAAVVPGLWLEDVTVAESLAV
jgi:hypothetical protein